jgi:hypothetical protein
MGVQLIRSDFDLSLVGGRFIKFHTPFGMAASEMYATSEKGMLCTHKFIYNALMCNNLNFNLT